MRKLRAVTGVIHHNYLAVRTSLTLSSLMPISHPHGGGPWTKTRSLELLQNNGYQITKCDRLSNDFGWQIRCQTGEILNFYDFRHRASRKNQQQMRALLGRSQVPMTTGTPVLSPGATPRDVFVVYGHDTQARNELEAMIRRWGLTR